MSTARVPAVVVASIQEFETWLITDVGCVASVLGLTAPPADATQDPEALPPRAAKALLTRWMAVAGMDADQQCLCRRRIARECSIPLLRKRCHAFATFASELARLAPGPGAGAH